MLERVDGTSFSIAELIMDRINADAANGVRWGTWTTLVAALSHFPKLGTEMELLGSGRKVNLMENQVDALWAQSL
jgi:hypothetical protein